MTRSSTLARVEYARADGSWVTGHASIALLDPAAYAARLWKLARVTVLDDRLAPTDEVYYSPGAELL